ncbi:MAG TPA: hypothetical protein VK789_28340 [Bryobacteraceae bacterium]|jgi:hypothetical protein|nr:hypothetical protein [Bryobacteraceae bacterium]
MERGREEGGVEAMAMRKSSRRELNKLRELLWFFVRGKRCYFCKRPLSPAEKTIRDGDGRAEPFSALDITIHHKNGDHDDKARVNETLAHSSCHKAHHARHHPRAGGRFVSRTPETEYLKLKRQNRTKQ